MKRLALLLSLLIPALLYSQSCLPEGIVFETQEQIDNFQTDYPGCTKIEGDVRVVGSEITNLSGLSVLTMISGDLIVNGNLSDGNPSLTSMSGLENLVSIGIDLFFVNNDSLTSLSGLNNLTTIGGTLVISDNISLKELSALSNMNSIGGSIRITSNDSLTDIEGLINLESAGGNLSVAANEVLQNLSGLNNLDSIGSVEIINNSSLQNLNGLNNLSFIEGFLLIYQNKALNTLMGLENLNYIQGGLQIEANESLTSLTGLDNIESSSISDLIIHFNNTLSTCDVQSICEYIVSPNGLIEISENAEGCNSSEELEEACETVSINELFTRGNIITSPNPISTSTTIEYQLDQPSDVTLSIVNHLGKQVELIQHHRPSGKQQITWNAEDLSPGMYFFKLQAGDQVATGKMMLVR